MSTSKTGSTSQSSGKHLRGSVIAAVPGGDLPVIPGYAIEGILGEGAESIVYVGQRDGQRYAIKVMRGSSKSAQDVRFRFHREVATMARVVHPALVQLVEAGEHEGVSYIVMEQVEGEDLASRLTQGPLTEDELLDVARTIGGALGEIHRLGLVHRDVKPANIVIQPDGGPKIVDFGFVGRMEDSGDIEREDLILGTLLYSPPEQTGLLKRAVDGRADLYAFGAVLFECVAGRTPFRADSIGDLLQQHAAVPAPDLTEFSPDCSPVIAAIVAKLLAKDPDDRYQTAGGLLADLPLVRQVRAGEPGAEFCLGAHDEQPLSAMEVPLIGRDDEMATLQNRWNDADRGHGTFVQVEGEGGLGKTRLVHELTAVVRPHSPVLTGKSQPSGRMPFAPLREAVDLHVNTLQALPLGEQEEGRQALRSAAGELGAIVRRLTPSLDWALGDLLDVRPLDPQSEQLRFYAALAEFFANLAREYGSLLLLVDDIQWLDVGSLEVLKMLAQQVDSAPLLVATTARNDTESEPARARFVKEVGPKHIVRVVLEPLGRVSVGRLVAAHLGGRSLQQDVVDQLAARSNGNPFVLGEYMHSLLDQGMLRPAATGWVVDAERFNEVALPHDVIRLLVDRMAGLGDKINEVLRTAAVMGFAFDQRLLSLAANSPDAVKHGLGEACRANLIERIDAHHYHFVHDRMTEALLSGIGSNQLMDLNQRIAEAIDKLEGADHKHLFALAQHYAAGHVKRNPQRVYETSLAAGIQALQQHSNEQAFALLDRSMAAADRLGLKPADRAVLLEHLGLACARTGKIQRAHDHFEAVLAVAQTDQQRARLYYLLGLANASEGRAEAGWGNLQQALDLLGEALPKNPVLAVLSLGWYWMLSLVLVHTGIGFGRAKDKERKRREEIARVLSWATTLSYFVGRPLQLIALFVRQLYNNHFLGAHAENAKTLVNYSMLVGLIFGHRKTADWYARAGVGMAEQLGNPEAIAWCRVAQAYAVEFCGDPRQGQQLMAAVLPDALNYLDRWNWSTAACFYAVSHFQQGRLFEAADLNSDLLDRLRLVEATHMVSVMEGVHHTTLNLLGRDADSRHHRSAQLEVAETLPNVRFVQTWVHAAELAILVDRQEFGDDIDGHIDAIYDVNYVDYHQRTVHCFIAYGRLGQYLQAEDKDRAAARRRVKSALRRAKLPPANTSYCAVHNCHLVVIQSVLAREKGRLRKANRLLDRASTLADEAGSLWGQFAVARERARLANYRTDPGSARVWAEQALAIADQEGWQIRTQQVRTEFNIREEQRSLSVSSRTRGSAKRSALTVQRYMDALLESQLEASSMLDPRKQTRAALDALIRVLGSERAFLFVADEEGNGLKLQAGRDREGQELEELTGYSSTVVFNVHRTGEVLVVTGTEEGEALGSESVVAYDLRSIMAAPLQSGSRRLGVVYTDSRLAKGLFTVDDADILRAIANQITIALEVSRMAAREADRRAMDKDLALTAAVQSFFLPGERYSRLGDLELSAIFRPAAQCSGDWWWYAPREDALMVLVGDVTGHGASAAMVTACVGTLFHGLRKRAPGTPVDEILDMLNADLVDITGGKYTMPLAAVLIDYRAKTLDLWGAGAPPVWLLHGDGTRKVLSCRGTPLGVLPFSLSHKQAELISGDRLFLYTDGIMELKLKNGRPLSKARLLKLFARTANQPIREATAAIETELMEIGEKPQADDMTLVCIGVR